MGNQENISKKLRQQEVGNKMFSLSFLIILPSLASASILPIKFDFKGSSGSQPSLKSVNQCKGHEDDALVSCMLLMLLMMMMLMLMLMLLLMMIMMMMMLLLLIPCVAVSVADVAAADDDAGADADADADDDADANADAAADPVLLLTATCKAFQQNCLRC